MALLLHVAPRKQLNVLMCSVSGLDQRAKDPQGQSRAPGGSEDTVREEAQSNEGKRVLNPTVSRLF